MFRRSGANNNLTENDLSGEKVSGLLDAVTLAYRAKEISGGETVLATILTTGTFILAKEIRFLRETLRELLGKQEVSLDGQQAQENTRPVAEDQE